jgi:putative ABC transport system permease protein
MMIFKIPLAWLQLKHDKVRLAVAITGICFASILMFMQLGFRDSLYESAIRLHKILQGDVILISAQSTGLVGLKTFSQRYIYQTLSIPGVASVSPIYIANGAWKNPQTRVTRNLRVIGFNPDEEVFNFPEVKQNYSKLKIPDVVLFDRASRSEYGSISNEINRGNSIITELEARKIKVVGLFQLGTSFGNDGNIITSDINFWRIFKKRKRGLIDIGLIKLSSEVNTSHIVDYLKQYLPRGVRVLSMKEFMNFEKNYWKKSTAIGFIFTLGTTMAFIVGTIIVYQILYSDVSAHLAEYATLKAMGYTDFYLIKVILQEALILAILGYIPSLAFTFCLYDLTKSATLLPIEMNLIRLLVVLFLTVIMCSFSGLIAINKLRSADPAEIF